MWHFDTLATQKAAATPGLRRLVLLSSYLPTPRGIPALPSPHLAGLIQLRGAAGCCGLPDIAY